MLKLERDKLLIAAVLIVVVSIDMINTSMLAPVLPNIPNLVPFFCGPVTCYAICLYSSLLYKLSHLCTNSSFCWGHGLL